MYSSTPEAAIGHFSSDTLDYFASRLGLTDAEFTSFSPRLESLFASARRRLGTDTLRQLVAAY